MDLAIFRERLRYYLTLAEKNQKSLAAALNMHPNVLSRKLNHTSKAIFSHGEIKELIRVLIQWGSLNYRGEVAELLELVGSKPEGFFSAREWQLPPLNSLEDGSYPVFSDRSSTTRPALTRPEAATSKRVEPLPAPKDLTVPELKINLPQPGSSFRGRAGEIGELVALLTGEAELRLVSLTGVGGTGKTRLALEVAARLLPNFRDGIYFLGLENVTERATLVSELANSLGIRYTPGSVKALAEALKKYLSSRQLLLLLDNFEQLVEKGATFLPELLRAAPELKILVTSRFPLQLSVEHEYRVGTLPVPSPEEMQSDFNQAGLAEYPALALFTDRAQMVRPEFALTVENRQVVAGICRKLDGLPLALELAAARLRAFSPQILLERLNLKLLRGGARDLPGRHQTLQATIEWSYDLLSRSEQALFARLSIFAEGFTLEAAEAVCQAEEQNEDGLSPLEGIESLLLKNLIRRWEDKSGATRYGMLQTIQEFGQEKLRERGEWPQLTQRYASFYLQYAQDLESQVQSKEQSIALRKLDSEYDNLRMVLATGLKEGETATTRIAIELAISLVFFWDLRNYLMEGRAYLEAALALTKLHTPTYIRLLNRLAWLIVRLGDSPLAQSYAETALTLARETKDKYEITLALHRLGLLAHQRWDLTAAQGYFEESLLIRRELGDKFGIRLALQNLSQIYFDLGDYEKAIFGIQESLKSWREVGDRRGICINLCTLGFMTCWVYRDFEAARSYFEEGLALSSEINDNYVAAYCWLGYGEIAFARGDYAKATQNYEIGLALGREMGERRITGCCLVGLGNVSLAQKEFTKSRQYYEGSLLLWRETSDREWAAKTLAGLSRISSFQIDNPEALIATATLGGAITTLITPAVNMLKFIYRDFFENALGDARLNLAAEDFNRAFTSGAGMGLEEAINFALALKRYAHA
jgi:predicted ATPase